jgi:hypothetical protein
MSARPTPNICWQSGAGLACAPLFGARYLPRRQRIVIGLAIDARIL